MIKYCSIYLKNEIRGSKLNSKLKSYNNFTIGFNIKMETE